MIEILTHLLLFAAAIVVLIAAVGVVKMPDVPTRMHATTKSGVLAIILIMISVAIHFNSIDVYARVMAIILFTFVSTPIAAHAIGRAAYLSGVSVCRETIQDELKEYYKETN